MKRPKNRSVTSFDVARRAGVSRSAVSRAFTPGASISEATRRKVMRAAEELGYRVNFLARELSNRRSELVGLVVAGLDTDPYRSAQVDALAKALVRRGFRPLLFCVDRAMDTSQIISHLLHYSVSGVIVTSDTPPTAICEECARNHVPLVLVDKDDRLPGVDLVNSDNLLGARLAARKLIEAGCRDLVVVEPSPKVFSIDARIRGFVEACKDLGAKVEVLTVGAPDYWGGRAAAAVFAEQQRDRPGVFCPLDTLALGFLDEVRMRCGFKIPGDLSIVGFDDIPQAGWAFAELTTIRQPVEELARQVVELLASRIEEPDAEPRTTIVPVELVSRRTA